MSNKTSNTMGDEEGEDEDDQSEVEEDLSDYVGDDNGEEINSDEEGGGDYEEYEDNGNRFQHYQPVTVVQRYRDFGVPEGWQSPTLIPGTGDTIHVMSPDNYVFTKHDPTDKDPVTGEHTAIMYRCQERRRGGHRCPATWKLKTHPNYPVKKGEWNELYYDCLPKGSHTHDPDLGNAAKR